jgi:hypothetical protein
LDKVEHRSERGQASVNISNGEAHDGNSRS